MKTKIKKILNEKEKIEKKNMVTTKGHKIKKKKKLNNYEFNFPPKKDKKRKKGNINIKVTSKIILNKNNQIIRSCCDYYFSLIKRKNPLIFSFCPVDDYNSMVIKTCIFSLSFSIYYAINFAFFDDEIMHKIYELGGKYNIMFFLPCNCFCCLLLYYSYNKINVFIRKKYC